MNKNIEIKLCEDNTVQLKCEDKTKMIKGNTLSALDIFDLLNFQDGDKYTVTTQIEGKKSEIIDPIKAMFDNLKEQINSIKSIDDSVEDEINKLNDDSDE